MGRSWTSAELAAASSAMKSQGHMGYEEFKEAIGMKHYTKNEWEHEQYKGRWEATPLMLEMVASGEIPAEYIGRQNVMVGSAEGTVLLTEGFHFVIDEY